MLRGSAAGLVLCGWTLALFNPWNLALAAAAVAGLSAYTPLKRRWWGGPPCNAAVMALLAPMGFLCGERSVARAFADPSLRSATASVFATYAVFVLLGYLKDVEADRATGYETVAVRFGRRAAVAASGMFCAAGLAASVSLLSRACVGEASRGPGLVLWLAGAVLLALAHVKAWAVRTDAEAFPAIAVSVRGFLALHFGEASAPRPRSPSARHRPASRFRGRARAPAVPGAGMSRPRRSSSSMPPARHGRAPGGCGNA